MQAAKIKKRLQVKLSLASALYPTDYALAVKVLVPVFLTVACCPENLVLTCHT